MTQRNGTEARFSSMWFVTASIKPDGTNAAASQNKRMRQLNLSATFEAPPSVTSFGGERSRFVHTNLAAPITSSNRTPYATAQPELCTRTPHRGSIARGYASKASKLPALLTAYKK